MDKYKNTVNKHIANLFRARFPFIYISTWEETRLVDMILEMSEDTELIKTNRKVYGWTQTDGLRDERTRGKKADAKSPVDVLNYIEKCKEPAIFLLKDFHVYFGANNRPIDYAVVRKVRDIVQSLKVCEHPINVVFISPTLVLPDDLQKDVTVVDFDLPNLDEIKAKLEEIIDANKENPKIKINLTENEKVLLCKAAQGLTLQEAENAFARALVERGALTRNEIEVILDEKCQVIKKTGMLEYVKSNLNIDDIGGLENLKRWLVKRKRSWLDEAQECKLPAPKGVLITGVAGCGKSLTAKATSAIWQLPLLKLDMGKIFSGIVGSSEENMRRAIKTAEAVAPSILWIDEIEKGLAGTNSAGDSGTTSRIFGTFLTWMQEKTKPVFVIATANKIESLPAELLRKGRFDEIFFVDLPTDAERQKIFELHLNKRFSGNPLGQELAFRSDEFTKKLVKMTEGFGGAEIEQLMVTALFDAFSENRQVTENDIFRAIETTVPLSITQSEQIMQIRAWANVRAVAATATEDRNEYKTNSKTDEDVKEGNADSSAQEEVKKNRGGRSIDF